MKLSELFKRLSYGELSNLAVSGEGSGVITPGKVPQLVRYTNEALLRLYSRFLLSEKSLVLEQVAHITSYELRAKYAESQLDPEFGPGEGGNVDFPFIKDALGDPFLGDVIKILEVHDCFGRTLYLNDASQTNSVFTPYPDVLQVPRPIAGAGLSILYQARHPVIVDDVTLLGEGVSVVLDQEVEIPFALEGALQSLIAALVFSHMNGQENIAKSQEFLGWADATCLEVEQKDLVSQSNASGHHKFDQRGFV